MIISKLLLVEIMSKNSLYLYKKKKNIKLLMCYIKEPSFFHCAHLRNVHNLDLIVVSGDLENKLRGG